MDVPSSITTELALYNYLRFSREARENLIKAAAKVHTRTWNDVWAHHDTIWFLMVIFKITTEEMIRKYMETRAKIAANNDSP